ncbi:MAG: peptide chain release factor N(5)-glutamine methyltransferase [Flavobacteriales bacterium]
MFVADNRVSSAKSYFFEQLSDAFTNSECKSMWTTVLRVYFGWSSSDILLKSDERFSESDLLRIRSVVKRLQANEPFQYIIGEVYFADVLLKIDARALIPRPETEELVALVQKQGLKFGSIIDFCTGSGCIALALKKYYPTAHVSALDLSQGAIELAIENAKLNKLELQAMVQDIFTWKSPEQFDLIVSNPPYIPQQEAAQMQQNVLAHEPHMALFVEDQTPLIFYERLAQLAVSNLQTNGIMALEVHENLAQQTLHLFEADLFKRREIHCDLQGKERMILVQKA